MSKNRKTWVAIGYAVGALLLLIGPFVPGYFCMDACSSAPPNLHLIVIGVILLVVTTILRKPPKASEVASSKPKVDTSGDIWKAPKNSVSGKRGTGVGCSIGCGGLILLLLTVNGWYSIMVIWGLLAALPFLAIAGLIWVIAASVAKRNKNKPAGDSGEPEA